MKKRKKSGVRRDIKKPNIKNIREIFNKHLSSKPKKSIKSTTNKSSQKLFILIILSLAAVAVVLAFSFLIAQKLVNPLNELNSSKNIVLAVLSENKEALYVKFDLEESKLSNLSSLNFSIYTKNGSFYSYYTSFVEDNYTIINKDNFFERLLKKEETKLVYDYVIYSNNFSNIRNFDDLLNVSVEFIFSDDSFPNIINSNPPAPKPSSVSPPKQNTPSPPSIEEESPCVPNCSGKQCGNNGCGGSCGSCDSDERCSQNQCVPDCIEGNWTNTSMYRCNTINNTIIREMKQVKDLCPSGTNETWIEYNCDAGKACYSGLGYPSDLCIDSNLTCVDSDFGLNYTVSGIVNNQFNDSCIDNKNLTEFYCFYNQIINDFEAKSVDITCDEQD